MDSEITKAMIAAGATLVGAGIVGGCGLYTARSITRKIEEMRLNAQTAMEREKLVFQQTLEKERQEFQRTLELDKIKSQREADADKHRMELYKLLYSERVTVAKRMSELVNSIMDICWDYCGPRDHQSKPGKPTFVELKEEISVLCGTNRWILDERVVKATWAFVICADEIESGSEWGKLQRCQEELINAISDMMLNDDLSRLVKR